MKQLNIELLRKVQDVLRLEKTHFDMAHFFKHPDDIDKDYVRDASPLCGTASCIAGHAVALAIDSIGLVEHVDEFSPFRLKLTTNLRDMPYYSVEGIARDLIGVDDHESDWLFYGCWSNKGVLSRNKDEAIAAIDTLIECRLNNVDLPEPKAIIDDDPV